MNGLIRVLLSFALFGMTQQGQAVESIAQHDAPNAEFLDTKGRLNLPQGSNKNVDPWQATTRQPSAPDRPGQGNPAPGVAGFLDETGRLIVPPGFSGSLDPAGYRLVSGDGEALRFAPEAVAGSGNAASGAWTGFGGIGNGCNGSVSAVAIVGAGDVYVGGDFSLCGDVPANGVARFDTSTQTWASLGSGAANGVDILQVRALAVTGSTLYVGGFFGKAGGAQANHVARFDTSTQTWASLGSGAANGLNSTVNALAVSGNTLYLGGSFTQAGGAPANRVARFDTNTQTWASLGSGAANGVNSVVNALAVSGNTVYVGGSFTQAGEAPANRVARFDTATQTWASLGSGAANGLDNVVVAVTVSDGMVYVGGFFSLAGGASASRVARFDTSTQTWASLGSGAANGVNNAVSALAASGSSVYVGGTFTGAGGAQANRVARFDTNTQTWASLGSGAANGVANGVVALIVSGSTVHAGGGFTQAGGAPANGVARFDTSAQTWSSLGNGAASGMNSTVYALAVSGSAVTLGGSFTQAGGAPTNFVARFDTSTQTWASLGNGAANGMNNGVRALAVSGNTVYVGGFFTQAGGAPANRVARFDMTTQTWASLGSGAANGVNGVVNALAVSGNTVYVGGSFTQAGGAPANRVARFDTATQTWASLGSGAANGVNSSVQALAVSGSTVYVGGFFTEAGGAPANYVARFDATTQTWASLGSGAANGTNIDVHALAVSGSMVYVGGFFSQAGGTPANQIARFDTTTQTWSSLGVGTANGVGNAVRALAVSGSALFVGGGFIGAGGAPANRVARFDTTTQTWASLGSGAVNGVSGSVNALATLADDTLYVGGNIGSAGGLVSSGITQWTPTSISQFAVAAPKQISACPCASSPAVNWTTRAASSCSPLGGSGTTWVESFSGLTQGSSFVTAYNTSTAQCASLPVGSTVTLTLSCTGGGEAITATDTLTVVSASCGSPPTLGSPSATQPNGDGSYSLTAPVTSNPGGGPLTAAVADQPAFGSLEAEIVSGQLVLTYTPASGRAVSATQTVRVVVSNGNAGEVHTYTINAPLELFDNGFEGG